MAHTIIANSPNTLSIRVEGKGQTVDYIEHLVLFVKRKEHTVRVLIHDDSYADQAWGRVERWDGTKWHEVTTIRGSALQLEHGVGYRQPTTDVQRALIFKRDRDQLVTLAEEIL